MSADGHSQPTGLFERDGELDALGDAVRRACAGNGGTVVIEGAAGIGKTSLLAHARASGVAADMRVVSASGAELERDFPYGVVRQFFESFLFTVAAPERKKWLRGTAEMAGRMFSAEPDSRAAPAEEFSLLHSLYWMCVNIAEERPLLMLLDDAQWADTPSLRYVEFTCRRLERVPLLFALATRIPDEDAPAPLLSLLAGTSAEVLRPAPLSLEAVESLVRRDVDPDADRAFTVACHQVTGGNPFLVGELLHEVLSERVRATEHAAAQVRALGPRGVSRVVLLRLRRLPPGARDLVEALSVSRDGVSLHELGELAGLRQDVAAEAASGLAAAEILDIREGVRFTHPVIRTTISEDIAPTERQRLHLRAARLQADLGRPAGEIAAHLLEVEPGNDPWVIALLREAARTAAQARDFAAAERLLARAMRESIDGSDSPELLAELGRAEARTGNPSGAKHLRAAADALDDPVRKARVLIQLATTLKFSLDVDQAARVLLEAIHNIQVPSEELQRQLYAELLGTRFIAFMPSQPIDQALASLSLPAGPPRDRLDSLLLAAAANDAAAALEPADRVVELGRRALADAPPEDRAYRGQARAIASVTLVWAEDFVWVYEHLTRALAAAQAASSALGVGTNATIRALCCYRAGRLLEAESDAAAALELVPEAGGLRTVLPLAVAYAVVSAIERGRPPETLGSLASNPALDSGSRLMVHAQLSWARGELCLARQEWDQALVHFGDCDRPDPSLGGRNPAIVPWREGAALAHRRLGDQTSARRLAAEAVRLAEQFGAPRAIGFALRAAALAEDGSERIEGLRRAETALATASSPLELARVKCDLGAALRAAGRRTDAQGCLRDAHELATSIGAVRIAERASDELAAAGVRPRRGHVNGLAALTPSERRVAELAAVGRTNREIAESLFVTQKTVETHLGHVYDKLGVRSRLKLPAALGTTTA
jgi:DNA-binding CsgD family transcriptional regulator